MNSDYKTQTSFLDDNGGKGPSQYMIAIRILQHKFSYKVMRLSTNDSLLTPPESGSFKKIALLGAYDDYKNVISILQNEIFNISNKKILSLCKKILLGVAPKQ